MNIVYRILLFFQSEMTRPTQYGWFHLLWIFIIIIILFILRNKKSEKSLKIVLGTYGIVSLILELLKQISWSFNYNNGNIIWDYQWYAFPFQLCSLPIYISIICLFLKESEFRTKLLSFLSYITILGGIATIILPQSCFVDDILINIQTMWIHCGSVVVSIYLMKNKFVKPTINNLNNSFKVFVFFIVVANLLNCIIYNIGILNGETFNMFYISPYFTSELPIFNQIQQNTPYMIFLLSYLIIMSIGGLIIFIINYLINKMEDKYDKK